MPPAPDHKLPQASDDLRHSVQPADEAGWGEWKGEGGMNGAGEACTGASAVQKSLHCVGRVLDARLKSDSTAFARITRRFPTSLNDRQ